MKSKGIVASVIVAAALTFGSGPASAQSVGTLVVDTTFQLKTADPAREFEPTANLILHAVYQNLLTFEGSDLTKLVPSLSDLPTVSDHATVFTFNINPDAKFSDGTPVTADDVVFSLNRVKNVKGSPSFLMDGVTVSKGANDHQVILKTKESDPALPYKLTNPALAIVNSKVIKANGGVSGEDAKTTDKAETFFAGQSAGSGPYVLDKWDIASEVVLKRNDAYWGEKANYDQIVIRNVESSSQQMDVGRGASQIALDLRPDQIDAIKSQVNVVSAAGADIAFLFNNENPDVSKVSSNQDFQDAVRYAIDYKGLLNIIGAGAERPGSIVPSMFAGALDAADGPSTDLEKAKAALAKSGIENPTVNLAYASDLTKNGVAFSDVAAKIQADLLKAGIKVNLKPEPLQTNLDNYRAGTLEMSVQWWGPDFPDPSDYLLFDPGELVGLRTGWKKGAAPEVTALGQKAANATDQSERTRLYVEWQKKLNQQGPYIALFQPAKTIASVKSLAPVAYNPMWEIDLGAVSPKGN